MQNINSKKIEIQSNKITEIVGPCRIVQLYANGFENLSTKEKIFAYYIHLASLAGRDITIEQHHKNALEIRYLLENIILYSTDINEKVLSKIQNYLKLFWINNGFYDNITSMKIIPEFSFDDFRMSVKMAILNGSPINTDTIETLFFKLKRIMFNPDSQPYLTNKTPGVDYIRGSAINYYHGDLSFEEIKRWSNLGFEKNPLNSTIVKENGRIVEKIWRTGGTNFTEGIFSKNLNRVIFFLEKAIPYASSEIQQKTIQLLIQYFKTGNPTDFRNFNIHWIKDNSNVDFIMGFIEIYLDPMGKKGEWESSIFYTDFEQTLMMENIAKLASYFENILPWEKKYKKNIIHIPTAKVINIISSMGGTGPILPIGINLPNEQSIKENFGSKSILLKNVIDTYNTTMTIELIEEFAFDEEEIENQVKYGIKTDTLHTMLHEIIGHGSGKTNQDHFGEVSHFLPGYFNTLEETRADLVALWLCFDTKLLEIGFTKSFNELQKIGQTMYQQMVRNALTQLRRIGNATQLEEDHMKNRQLIANYLLQNENAVRRIKKNGKTFFKIIDFEKTKIEVGKLLSLVMKIKAEKDLQGAKKLVDKFALKIDIELRNEVQERIKKIDIPAYTAFIMPNMVPIKNNNGEICDINITYNSDFQKQMLSYSKFTEQNLEELEF